MRTIVLLSILLYSVSVFGQQKTTSDTIEADSPFIPYFEEPSNFNKVVVVTLAEVNPNTDKSFGPRISFLRYYKDDSFLREIKAVRSDTSWHINSSYIKKGQEYWWTKTATGKDILFYDNVFKEIKKE